MPAPIQRFPALKYLAAFSVHGRCRGSAAVIAAARCTLASSWRFLASVFWVSVSSGLRGASNNLCRSALMRFQSGHFVLTQLRLGPLEIARSRRLLTMPRSRTGAFKTQVRFLARSPSGPKIESRFVLCFHLLRTESQANAHQMGWKEGWLESVRCTRPMLGVLGAA